MADMVGRRAILQGAVAAGVLGGGVARAQSPATKSPPGLIFMPGAAGRWDSERVSCPRVIRDPGGGWKMWYYGRDPTFDHAITLPTGRIGVATSSDGVHWTRVNGPDVMGSVMGPAKDQSRFDAAFVASSDVRVAPGGYQMTYFGGSAGSRMIRGESKKGFPIRPGLASSTDGVKWTRDDGPYSGAILDVGPPGSFDANMVGWPQIIQGKDGLWRLYYHAVSADFVFAVGLAVSEDGKTWRKVGPVLTKGESGDFDAAGPSTRQVFLSGGRYVMMYEGFNTQRTVAIGMAVSDDGEHWTKVKGPLKGGAVLEPTAPGSWDSRSVGTPWVVALPGGGHHLYYVGNGVPADGRPVSEMSAIHMIGLATTPGDDFTAWTRWGA